MANLSVLYEAKDQIAYITLNRPEKLNAVNMDVITGLAEIWERFEKDPDARVAIFRGAGRAFCAGIDLTMDNDLLAANQHLYHMATRVNGFTVLKPVIGAVQGYALGTGWRLATGCCDITVASEGTQFGYPEPAVGRGDIVEFVPYMPFKLSLEFLMTGQWIDARKACEWGMVNKVVADSDLMKEAVKYAEKLKKNAPLAMRAIKYGQYKAADNMVLRVAREFEQFRRPVNDSEDLLEGSRAFKEKRPPVFKGR